jgi:hypothetical protein
MVELETSPSASLESRLPPSRKVYFDRLKEAVLSKTYVSLGGRRTSSPHEFYRYPARFPPAFARAAIEAFTSPGQLVLDPFAGGGTTLVESRLAARPAIGSDLNPLAVFVSSVKSRPLGPRSLNQADAWSASLGDHLLSGTGSQDLSRWSAAGYFRNADDAEVAPIRDLLARCLASLDDIDVTPASDLARCAILRTGQWALDMRRSVPERDEVLESLIAVTAGMVATARKYSMDVQRADASYELTGVAHRTRVVEQGLPGLAKRLRTGGAAPALVLTSPPYPGVYVNYHRWKVRGRRETPAPYWLANRQDGNGLAYYTMAARSDLTQKTYFKLLTDGFADVAKICDLSTMVVQMVGFHDPATDLPRYLLAMEQAGFTEVRLPELANAEDGRLWRSVPNRRWWAANAAGMQTSAEVVLVHVLKGRAS